MGLNHLLFKIWIVIKWKNYSKIISYGMEELIKVKCKIKKTRKLVKLLAVQK